MVKRCTICGPWDESTGRLRGSSRLHGNAYQEATTNGHSELEEGPQKCQPPGAADNIQKGCCMAKSCYGPQANRVFAEAEGDLSMDCANGTLTRSLSRLPDTITFAMSSCLFSAVALTQFKIYALRAVARFTASASHCRCPSIQTGPKAKPAMQSLLHCASQPLTSNMLSYRYVLLWCS